MTSTTNLIFSEKFIEEIPLDLINGVVHIGRKFFDNTTKIKNSPNAIDELISVHAIMYNFLKNNKIDPGKEPTFNLDKNKLLAEVDVYLRPILNAYSAKQRERIARAKFDEINAKVSSKFGNYILYELSENQIENIQYLINELRVQVNESDSFDDSHKQRILIKLEKLQTEIHVKMTNFDKIFGLVVETQFLYKNYKEAKPLFDLSVKIANIAIDSMALANGLPAPSLFQLT